MSEILKRPEFTIRETEIDLHGSTDIMRIITLETETEEFEFTFTYGNLINFVRCKK